MIKKGIIRNGKGRFTKGNNALKFEDFEIEKIKKMYSNENLNVYKISEIFNCNYNTIYKILKKSGIKTNKRNGRISWNKGLTKETDNRVSKGAEKNRGKFVNSKFKKRDIRITGENNHNWQGGISFEPYNKSFTNKFKRAIRKRDNQICMLCGIHQERVSKALDVHHINYDKKISLPQNCISLCNKCHTKTNFNRDHWTKFFQSLLIEKYGYEYTPEGEIKLELNKI